MTSEVESKRWLVGEMTKNVWKTLKTIIKKGRLYIIKSFYFFRAVQWRGRLYTLGPRCRPPETFSIGEGPWDNSVHSTAALVDTPLQYLQASDCLLGFLDVPTQI